LSSFARWSPTSAHAPVLVGVSIALGELAVGLATLVGRWVRVTAGGGLLLSLTFFLTVSFHTRPYYYGSDIVFLFAWTVPLLAGSWPGWTADSWIATRARSDADPRRRTLVLGGVGALVLAATAGVLAGITAAVGRALHGDAASSTASLGSQRPTSRPPSSQPSSVSSSASEQPSDPGRELVAVSDLPPGRALRFTDGNGGPAWLLHEANGDFRAFSAVCTHAGCTVGLASGQFVCPCHGGRYSVQDGAVLGGPPPSPLRALNVRVIHGKGRLL
jgi:thiosulfate dehydrogenase (quinone) large subunit